MRRNVFVLIVAIFNCIHIFSQFRELEYEKINTSNGLSNDNIQNIIQDNNGLIWFVTADGLNSYDGFDVRTYKGPRGTDITRDITNTRLSPNNNIYIFSSNGINIFDIDSKKFSKFEVPEQLIKNEQKIDDIQFEEDGSMWLISNKKPNLYHYQDGVVTPYEVFSNNISEIKSFKDSKSNLWIFAQNFGLYKFNVKERKSELVNLASLGLENSVSAVTEDSVGNIWIGIWKLGIMLIKNSNNLQNRPEGKFFNIQELTTKNSLIQIFCRSLAYQQEKNRIYAGHSSGYITIDIIDYESDRFRIEQHLPDFSNPDGFHANMLLSMLIDKEGIIWFGSSANGVNKLNYKKKKFTPLSSKNFIDLRFSWVHSILQFGNGKYLLGIQNSAIGVFDPTTDIVTPYRANPELLPLHEGYLNVPYCQLKTEINNTKSILFGTRYRGVWIISCNENYSEVTSVIKINERRIDGTRTIVQLDKNKYLFGCDKGVVLLNIADTDQPLTQENISFKFIPLLNNNDFSTSINKIYKDSKGIYWIAPKNKGLYKVSDFKNFQEKEIKFVHYNLDLTSPYSLHSKDIQTIYEDSKGRLWFGGIDAGLIRYDGEKDRFIEFTNEDGWPCQSVFSIIEDNNGLIWTGTDMGLIKFDPLQSLGEGLVRYTTDDGLPGNVFLPNSCIKDDKGNLLFGGNKGLNIFNPEKISYNTFIPPVVFTNLTIYSKKSAFGSFKINADTLKEVNGKKYLHLRHYEYAIRIEFTSLTYSNQTKNKFAYQLEGFDDNWIYRDASNRYAYYSNLKPGKYVFKVKAYNSDGLPGEVAEEIKITVRPPWWKTIPFYFILIFIVGAIARSIILNREQRTKRDKEILEKKLKEGEEELNKQKQALTEQSEELKKRDIAERDQKWFNKGMINVGDSITKSKENLNELSQVFLGELISYIGAVQGCIYLLNDDDETDKHLIFERDYGVSEQTYENIRVEIGENLIGTCFISNEKMLINDVPQGYTSISSGLGTSIPKQILLIPLVFDNKPIGVIEISTLESFSETKVNWVEKICEMYSSNIFTLKMHNKMTIMVESMQQQTEEMKAQEEELIHNMEELHTTNEEASRRENELLKQIKEKEETINSLMN